MHVRFSTVVGLPVIEDSGEEVIATIFDVLIQPDTGKIEGFFVRVPIFLRAEELFVSTLDIVHWGTRVRVRDSESLAPIGELVRVQQVVDDGRPLLRQRIVTENGTPLGVCRDMQFDTVSFSLEWLFPRRFWRWRTPLPASSIVLVRKDAIVVRDAVLLPEVVTGPSVLRTLDPLGTSTVSPRVMQRKKSSCE